MECPNTSNGLPKKTQHFWKLWNDFGIKEAKQSLYFIESYTAKIGGNDDTKASVYVKGSVMFYVMYPHKDGKTRLGEIHTNLRRHRDARHLPQSAKPTKPRKRLRFFKRP